MRKTIYLSIIERLKTANLGIKHLSLWNNNISHLMGQKGFLFPAIFIEFETIRWMQLQQGARSAELRVRLHVVTSTLASPEDGSMYQAMSLEHLDLIDRIKGAMQGFSGAGFNGFMLVESITDHDHEQILHNEECFVTRITEVSPSNKPLVPLETPPRVNTSVK